MGQVPSEFEREFESKGETFREIAALLYRNPDRQYTRDELAEHFDCSTTTIDNHTREMREWLDRREGQTTYGWNTDAHDPGSTEGVTAVAQFYADLFALFKKHSNTAPGTYAIMGFAMFLSGVVVFSFYVGFSLSITADSAVPVGVYLVIAFGCAFVGLIMTFLSPLQAWVNSVIWPRLPDEVFRGEN